MMCKIIFLKYFLFIWLCPLAQSVAINKTGAAAHPSAILDIQSNDKGLLIPRMTTQERNLLQSPATGLLVFDNSTGSFWFKSSGNWIELVDTSSNLWKKSSTNAILASSGNVGIGNISPNYDLHISGANPAIAMFDTEAGSLLSGVISGDSTDLKINANRTPLNFSRPPGNIIMQTGTGINTAIAGNVGIGTSMPLSKLHVNGNQYLSGELILLDNQVSLGRMEASNNDFRISTTGNNSTGMIILQAGLYQRMRVTNGHFTQFGSNSSGSFVANVNFTNTGELNRPEKTGTANLLPLCYGRINLSGTIYLGSGNFTVSKTATGDYKITIPSEGSLYANQNNYMIFANANHGDLLTSVLSDNTILIKTRKYSLFSEGKNCSCIDLDGHLFSTITSSTFYKAEDEGFSFMVIKR